MAQTVSPARQPYPVRVLGTDRYPPFSLGEEPGYPARLDIDYPTPA